MKHPLQEIFSSFVFYSEIAHQESSDYRWFRTNEQEIIGILEEELTKESRALLTLFLRPHQIDFPVMTEEEKLWQRAIYKQEHALEVDGDYRFVAFSFNRAQMTPLQFKVAICALFDREVPILWESDCEGVIIEERPYEATTYEEMIDVLMSDLSVNIKFLVGTYYRCLDNVHDQYEAVCLAARLMAQHAEKNVMTFIDAIPYFFIDGKSEQLPLKELVLQEYVDDEETLNMIRRFIHFNLNISETAKALHLHRNSLQYRLDRLVEKTGIDLRQFHHSMAVYLVL